LPPSRFLQPWGAISIQKDTDSSVFSMLLSLEGTTHAKIKVVTNLLAALRGHSQTFIGRVGGRKEQAGGEDRCKYRRALRNL
jgi:hypothetical protein